MTYAAALITTKEYPMSTHVPPVADVALAGRVRGMVSVDRYLVTGTSALLVLESEGGAQHRRIRVVDRPHGVPLHAVKSAGRGRTND